MKGNSFFYTGVIVVLAVITLFLSGMIDQTFFYNAREYLTRIFNVIWRMIASLAP